MGDTEGHSTDFRAYRRALGPDDFALPGDVSDFPGPDLINRATWDSIVALPDDVSLRTSSEFGSVLQGAWSAWGGWVDLVHAIQRGADDVGDSPIAQAALDSSDDFQASTYIALVGFYRIAISALRSVVEHTTIGLHLQLSRGDQESFVNWLEGDTDTRFGWAADFLPGHPVIRDYEDRLFQATGDRLFTQKPRKSKSNDGAGLARRIFSELSSLTHAGPRYSTASFWPSNGPVFVPEAFDRWYRALTHVYALALIEVSMACRSSSTLEKATKSALTAFREEVLRLLPQDPADSSVLRGALSLQ